MKFVVLGTSNFTIACVQALLESGCEILSVVSLPHSKLPNNSANIQEFCNQKQIGYFEIADINSSESLDFLSSRRPDYILSTWPHLLNAQALRIPKNFVIGSHPTKLPFGKGRHPMHWLIALGMQTTSLSFFVMREGIDDGDLLIQDNFSVSSDINTANENLQKAGYFSLKSLVNLLKKDPSYRGVPQSIDTGNYWRKRDTHDVTLDPRMSAEMVMKLTKSFCPPYPGAILQVSPTENLRIVDASIVEVDLGDLQGWQNYEHGFIFEHKELSLLVRFDDALMRLHLDPSFRDFRNLTNKKIHPPAYYFAKRDLS